MMVGAHRVFRKDSLVLAGALVVVLSGCTSTGLDSKSSFSCKAPPGISCASLSGVYANAAANNLPGSPTTAKPVKVSSKESPARVTGEAPATGTPVLSDQVVLRVWVAPWEDSHKALHDQSFLYVVADPGHWQIAHTRGKIANQYRVVLAPATQQQPEPSPKPGQAVIEKKR